LELNFKTEFSISIVYHGYGRNSKGEHMRKFIILIPCFLVFISGCLTATPFQSARVVESGETSTTTSVMHSTVDNGYSLSGWTQLEMTGRAALVGGRADMFFSAGAIVFGTASFGGTLGFGCKVELIDDILSLEMPARLMIAGSNPMETTHFYPRLIASIPLNDATELNLSATRYYYIEGNFDRAPVGYAAGLAFGKRGELIIRPEIGVLYNYYNDLPTYQIGVSFTPPTSKRRDPDAETPNPGLM